MTESRKIQLEAEMSTVGVKQGAQEIKATVSDMANSVSQEAARAGQSVGGIGDGGERTSQKVDRATKSMIQSIQRVTAQMEAGSKSSAKYYQTLAQQRGVDVNALRPYLDQLDEVQLKQRAATAALGAGSVQFDKYGMSAKQTAAAMRGVPAQLTDIFVSLQGGQRPMTVLLQQGGQLKDMFGGIVPAAQALATTALKMVNPLTLAAGAAAGLYAAYRMGAAEAEAFERTLLVTGGAAGVTAAELQKMSVNVGGIVSTQRAAAAALNEFANSAKVGSGSMEEFAVAAIRWEEATGTAVSETVKHFAELANDPLKASLKLNESMNYLTASVYNQIAALVEQGNKTEAAAVAQKAFADTINHRAPEIVQNIGTIERAWVGVKGAVAGAINAFASIGRATGLAEQLANEEAKLLQLQDSAFQRGAVRRVEQVRQQELVVEGIRNQISEEAALGLIQKQVDDERKKSLDQAELRRNYLGDSGRQTQAQQREAAIKAEQDTFKKAVAGLAADSKEYEKIYAAHKTALINIDKQYADKKQSGGISTSQTELARLLAAIEAERQREEQLHSLAGAQADLNEHEKQALVYGEKLALTTNAKTRAELEHRKALAEQAGAMKRANDEYARGVKESQSRIDSVRKQTSALEDQIDTYGMGKSAIEAMTIARLEEKLAIDSSLTGDQRHLELLRQEIEERQKLLGAMRTKEALDAQLKEWQNWEREVDRIFDQLGQSLTDQLFEGGKSARDMLKDLFKNLVLRVAIQPMLSGLQGMVTNQIGGLLGYQDPRQQSGVGGMLQNANSLNSIFGAGYQALTGASAGASSASLGYANLVGAMGGDSIGALISANGGWEGALSGLSSAAGTAFASGITAVAPSVMASLGSGAAGALASGMATTSFSASLAGGAAGAAGGAAAGAGGLMAGLSAAAPYIGIGLAAASAFGLFDSGPPKTRHGQRTTIDYTGGAYGISAIDDRQAAGSEQAALAAAQSAVAAANDLFARIGVNAGIESFYAIMESSVLGDRNGVASGGMLRIGDQLRQIGIKQSGDMTFAGVGGWSSEDMLSRLQTDITLTTLEAFQALGDQLPSVLSNMLAGIDFRNISAETAQDLATRFAAVADGATQFLAAIESMPFEQLRGLGFDAAAGLIAAAGGLENLNSGLASYYENFYSQEEKLARSAQNISSALTGVGLVMPDVTQGVDAAKAAFRELFESIDPSTEWGATAMATMLGVNQSFADLAAGLQELNGAAETVAGTVRTAADILRERLGLEGQLLQLQGSTAEIRRRELEALDESNHALQRYIWALQDQAAASQAAAQSMASAWSSLGTASGWAAQYLGDVSGLQAQLSMVQASYAGSKSVSAREAALGQIIALEQAIWNAEQQNRQAEVQAAQRQAQALQQQLSSVNALLTASQRLKDFAEGLQFGAESGLSDAERLDVVAGQYRSLLGRAQGGDTDAMAQLQGMTGEYLSLAQQLSGSQAEYSVVSGRIAAELAAVAVIQEASAKSQADTLTAQIEAAQAMGEAMSRQFEVSAATKELIAQQLEDSALQFGEQMKRLQRQIEQGDVSIALLDGMPLELTGVMQAVLVPPIASIADAAMSAASMAASSAESARQAAAAASAAAASAAAAAAKGSQAGSKVPGFAAGGYHLGGLRVVGEYGPELEATGPARIYNASQTTDILRGMQGGQSQRELINEVRALREQNARLEGRLASIERSTGQFATQFAHLTMDGNEMLVRDVKTLEEEGA